MRFFGHFFFPGDSRDAVVAGFLNMKRKLAKKSA
jgi:hypothetical protein